MDKVAQQFRYQKFWFYTEFHY